MFRLIAISDIEKSGISVRPEDYSILLNLILQKRRIYEVQERIIAEIEREQHASAKSE